MLNSALMKIWLRLKMFVFIFAFLPPSLFAQNEFLPTIEDTLCPTDWLYAGPFSIGAREGIVGVIEDLESFRPQEGDEHRSILPQGGKVSWKRTAPDSLGWVKLEYENVQWDTLMDYYGVPGILDAGYAYTEFENTGKKRALVIAEKVGSFYLNGKRFRGDPYAHNLVRAPVILEDGMNRVLVPLSGYGDHRFMFKLIPAPLPVMLIPKDVTLPDIIEGEKQKLWTGITILNTTSKRLRNIKLSIRGGQFFKENEITISSLMPLCVKKIPIEIEIVEPLSGMDTTSIRVKISYQDFSSEDRLPLRIREKGKSYKLTFISKIDRSCQYYAVLPPKDYDPQGKYSLILTLHGAGVEASGLVDCYSQKDWAFVVVPTNRRRFGFDWQDWGRLDALEVLDLAKKTFPIDTNRVYLTGHSMGGHGTWHIALTHTDLFAAAAPLAGWTCFQLYIPWFLQKSYMFAEPGQIAIRDMSLREDFAPNFVENALNLPIFISHGGNDDNVPTVHSRLFVSLLEELGYEYHYKEIPNKGHWFNLDTLDKIVCVDDPELMDFLKSKKRDFFPKHVIFKTTNIGQSHKSYWVEIIQQEKPFFESRLEADVKDELIEIKTKNIRQFALSLSQDLLPYGRIAFLIDGKKIGYILKTNEKLTFYKKGNKFRIGRIKHPPLTKSPEFYGPIKQAYFSPFVLVYGTKGDSLKTEIAFHQARLEAARWWRRANGFAEILPDTEVTSEVMKKYNLILFGGPEENFVTAKLNKSLPIKVKDQKIFFGRKEIHGDNIAAEFIYPNPANPERFVFVHQGVGLEGLKLSTFFTALYSGAGLPDFVIFDDEVKYKGWGGVLCAGFFDSDWQMDEKLTYLQE
ncbi:MAG: prolyl oligopeptidase family serine peptidase [candidate division Zixibacteria bacterium]|nr:prolyl oligopeptidase family serine peptidase [candidate division Zixibacteria bacterium]